MQKEFLDAERALRKNGYERVRVKGSHIMFSNGSHTVVLNIKPNRMVLARIMKECGIRT